MRPRWIPLARRLAAKRRGLPYVRRLEPLAIVDDPREIRDSRLVILGQRAEAAKPPSTVAQRPSKVRNTRLVASGFSILSRQVLARGSFTSTEDLAAKLDAYIAWYLATDRPLWSCPGLVDTVRSASCVASGTNE